MSGLLRGFGMFLLPLCGWLAGDAVQARTQLCILPLYSALSSYYSASGRRSSTAGQTCKVSTGSFAARACWRKLPAVHCSSCLRRNNSLRQSAPVLQSAFAVSAAQRLHRNANGLATIRRGSRTIYSRRAAQHSGRPVCRTVWDWQAA